MLFRSRLDGIDRACDGQLSLQLERILSGQQMLGRMPALAITDLHKGDAVMMVTTRGTDSSAGTVITLLSGVEPILQAAPNGSQAMMLAPWNLGGPSGDTASQ